MRQTRTDTLFAHIGVVESHRVNITADPIGLEGGVNLMGTIAGAVWPNLSGLGIGWEVNFIYGYGRSTVYCCDENNNYWRIRLSKHCLGAGFDLAGGGDIYPGTCSRKQCPNGFGGFSAEFGAGPFEAIGGIGNGGSLIPGGGIGIGVGGKATMCYYIVHEKDMIGCCPK